MLRWTPQTIEKGFQVINGRKIYLTKAVLDGTIIKIDLITILNGRFVEFSNVYELITREHKEEIHAQKTVFYRSLKNQVLKYVLLSKSYFKALKRIFTLARLEKDEKLIVRLVPFLNSDVGILYQVYSDINTLVYMLDNFDNTPWDVVINEIDFFKSRISNVISFSFGESKLDDIFDHLTSLSNTVNNRKQMLNDLETINEYILNSINDVTLKFMKKIDLFPLPNKFYP